MSIKVEGAKNRRVEDLLLLFILQKSLLFLLVISKRANAKTRYRWCVAAKYAPSLGIKNIMRFFFFLKT